MTKPEQELLIKNAFKLNKDDLLFLFFEDSVLQAKYLPKIIAEAKFLKNNNIKIFCTKTEQFFKLEAKKYQNFTFDIFEFIDIYNKLEQEKIELPTTVEIKENKVNFSALFGLMFEKSRSRVYFYSALFLAFTCLFTPFKIYYAVFASMFVIFAFICKFKNNFKQKVASD